MYGRYDAGRVRFRASQMPPPTSSSPRPARGTGESAGARTGVRFGTVEHTFTMSQGSIAPMTDADPVWHEGHRSSPIAALEHAVTICPGQRHRKHAGGTSLASAACCAPAPSTSPTSTTITTDALSMPLPSNATPCVPQIRVDGELIDRQPRCRPSSASRSAICATQEISSMPRRALTWAQPPKRRASTRRRVRLKLHGVRNSPRTEGWVSG